jgi:hypothetical protein
MKDDIELPRRGYDTKDVEEMTAEHEAASSGAGRRTAVLVVLIVAAAIVIWLITRG